MLHRARRHLTRDQLSHWQDHGFLILPQLFRPERVAELSAEVDTHWREEMDDFDEYIDKQLAGRGLDWTTFTARAGDVFTWHAQLYDGGAPTEDMSLTPKSLVTHYFRAQDHDPTTIEDIGGGRYYLRRGHQPT